MRERELWQLVALGMAPAIDGEANFQPLTRHTMKTILNLCSAASFACVLWFAAGNWLPLSPSGVARKTAGSAGRPAHSQVVEFGSHARSKVVQYFDTYRTEPLGLPADCAARVKVGEIPAAWSNTGIRRGVMVRENERSALLEAPAELVRVLPADFQNVRYFLAGCNLVAVNGSYKVLDSIRIPTVRLPDGHEMTGPPEPLQLVRHWDRRGR